MKPDIWGPSGWTFIHSIAYDYPETPDTATQRRAIEFIVSLTYLLPCKKCRFHLKNHLVEYDLDDVVRSKSNFFNFTVDLHNEVNRSLNKPVISYEDALLTFYKQPDPMMNKVIGIATILLLLLGSYYVMHKKKKQRLT